MAAELYGQGDRTLRILEQELGIDVHARGNEVRLVGSESGVATARKVLEELYGCLRGGQSSRRGFQKSWPARSISSFSHFVSGSL